MKGNNILKILLVLIIVLISSSYLFWYFQDNKSYNIYILDKTVLDDNRSDHKSFNWILNHYKYSNKDHKLYDFKKDYYGFFPEVTANNKKYKIRSLRLYEILSMADDIDMVYYTDTYGVSFQDWYNKPPDKFHSPLIYGGLNQNDYLLLSEMKRKDKLIITEFNMLGSPTSDLIRQKTETLFDFYWTGWTGCYIKSLNQTNPGLPDWICQQYEIKYNKKWNFTGPGIILVKEDGSIIVLRDKVELKYQYPQIFSNEINMKKYGIPSVQNYNFWFDIINPGTTNKVVSTYHLNVTANGSDLLKSAGIPSEFPAIIEHLNDYKFYYFAGDFADRDISMTSSYFKGFPQIVKVFTLKNSSSKMSFFWRFYLPLINNILNNNLLQQ